MNRNFVSIQALSRGVKVIAGSFAPDGTNPVSAVKGKGFSVARTGVGIFTVTLEDTYVDLLDAQVSLQLNSADDKFMQLGPIDVQSAKTIVLRCWDISGAALTDIAAHAQNRVHFSLNLKASTVD